MSPEFDFARLDYQALTPAERNTVIREAMWQARTARALELRSLLRWLGPAAARIVLRGVAAAGAAWRRHRRRREQRMAARRLYEMDDRELKDIGLRRGDIEFAVSGAVDPTSRPRTPSAPQALVSTDGRPGPARQPDRRAA